jgi:hypothetical protein
MSHACSTRKRITSSVSPRIIPRSGTFKSPVATCKTTGCPTQTAYALCMCGPLRSSQSQCHFLRAGRSRLWYVRAILALQRYCWFIRHTFSNCSTALVPLLDCSLLPDRAPCAHAEAIHSVPEISSRPLDRLMISPARLLSFIAMLNLCWLECAQNPAVFCYRVGWDLLAPMCHSRRGGAQQPTCSI